MENILPIIPAWIMLAIGVGLLGTELLIGTFVILFFGLAAILVGGIGFFIDWSAGEYQVLAVFILGGVLTFTLRPFFMKGMSKEDLPLETMQAGDTGTIVENAGELRLFYKGTTWAFKNTSDTPLNEGDEVVVNELKNNVAMVSK